MSFDPLDDAAGMPSPDGSPAIEVRGLTYEFGPMRAVDHLSFRVEPGELFGLLGPNGAGKTTTIRVLTTLLRPSEETGRVFGLDTRSSTMAVRRLLGCVPQQLSIDAQLTGYDNLWLFARLFDVPRRERRERVRETLQLVGLDDVSGRMGLDLFRRDDPRRGGSTSRGWGWPVRRCERGDAGA